MADLEIELIARALILRSDRVLLCKSKKHNYFYLPGGHIEFGEPAAAALAREIDEEMGVSCSVGALALMHEHFFRQGSQLHHELNLVFHVELASGDVGSREKKIAFQWIVLGELGGLDLRPAMLQRWLSGSPAPGEPARWISESLD